MSDFASSTFLKFGEKQKKKNSSKNSQGFLEFLFEEHQEAAIE